MNIGHIPYLARQKRTLWALDEGDLHSMIVGRLLSLTTKTERGMFFRITFLYGTNEEELEFFDTT